MSESVNKAVENPSAAVKPTDENRPDAVERFEGALLWTRWLQVPLLIGLLIALIIVEIKFAEHLINTILSMEEITRERAILVALDLIDMVLIANLIVMVVISGYETFVSSLHVSGSNSVPPWMRRSTAGQVKMRIAVTILLISTIHLLHAYLDPEAIDREEMVFMLVTQLVFIATVIAFVVFRKFGEVDTRADRTPGPAGHAQDGERSGR